MTDKLQEKTITLDTPITRGKTTISEVTLRKPLAGALRGTRLNAVMEMDVAAMMTLIPRISTPSLTGTELEMMDAADLTTIAVEVVTFLLPKSALANLPTT